MPNHFIAVVDKAQAQKLIQQGELEVGRGTAADLVGILPGDGVMLYAPKLSKLAADFVQAFVGIGRVTGAMPHAVEIHPGVVRARLFVNWSEAAQEADIRPLLERLSVTRGKGRRWGPALRRSLLQVSEADFFAVAEAMGAEVGF